MKHSHDLLISGAGPAGATCALALKHSGLRVALLDKAVFPRDKICGDALSGKVVSVLKYMDPELEASLHAFPEKLDSWGIRFFAPNGDALDIPFKSAKIESLEKAPGFISKRIEFDAFLQGQAAKLPEIEMMEGFEVKSVEQKEAGVILSDGNRKLSAPLVIAADGAHSVITKQLSDIRVEKETLQRRYSGLLSGRD